MYCGIDCWEYLWPNFIFAISAKKKKRQQDSPPFNKDFQDNMPLIDHPDKWLKNHCVLHAKLEAIDALKLITGSWLEPQLDDIKSLEPVAEEMRLQRFEKKHSKWVKTRGSSFVLLVNEFGGTNGCFGSLIDNAEGDPVKLYHAVKGNCVQDARGQFEIQAAEWESLSRQPLPKKTSIYAHVQTLERAGTTYNRALKAKDPKSIAGGFLQDEHMISALTHALDSISLDISVAKREMAVEDLHSWKDFKTKIQSVTSHLGDGNHWHYSADQLRTQRNGQRSSASAQAAHSRTKCYNCLGFGHFKADCPNPAAPEPSRKKAIKAKKARVRRKKAKKAKALAAKADTQPLETSSDPKEIKSKAKVASLSATYPSSMTEDEIWAAEVQKARGIRPTCLLAQRTDLRDADDEPPALIYSSDSESDDSCSELDESDGKISMSALSASFNLPWEPSDSIDERKLTPPVAVTATEAISTIMDTALEGADVLGNCDSGCSVTMSPDIRLFTRLRKIDPVRIVTADGEIMAYQAGPMRFRTKNQAGQLFTYEISFGYFVPGLTSTLFSVSGFLHRNSGRRMEFRFEHAILYDEHGVEVIRAHQRESSYYFFIYYAPGTVSGPILALQADNTAGLNKSLLWHYRLGHCNSHYLNLMSKSGLVNGMNGFRRMQSPHFCDDCLLGKMKSTSRRRQANTRYENPGEMIGVDLAGPRKPEFHGSKYYMKFTDHATRFSWVFFLKKKSEAAQCATDFLSMIDRQFSWQAKQFRLDRGELQTSQAFTSLCRSQGIILDPTTPDSSYQNGIEERSHLRVDDMARSMRLAAKIPGKYWIFAVRYAVNIINKSLTTAHGSTKTPYERLTGRVPDVSAFRIFGCTAFAKVSTHKNAPRSVRCQFLGFAPDGKGNQLLRLDSRSLMISDDVVFNERPILERAERLKNQLTPHRDDGSVSSTPDDRGQIIDSSSDSEDDASAPEDEESPPEPIRRKSHRSTAGKTTRFDDYEMDSPSNDEVYYSADDGKAKIAIPNDGQAKIAIPDGRSQHPSPPTHSTGRYYIGRLNDPFEPDELADSKPGNDRIFESAQAAMHTTAKEYASEPSSYHDAMRGPDASAWQDSIDEEMKSLLRNGTWDIVDQPKNVKPIGSQWVFKNKLAPDGSIARRKSRLVARGDQQVHEDSFYETFAPVVKFTTVRLLFAIATILNLHDLQLDVDNAYLHAELDEEVYMRFPQGFYQHLSGLGKVLRLRKSIYGLKQAGRAFNIVLDKHLMKLGFIRCVLDAGCYMKRFSDGVMYCLTYVDDLLVFSSSKILLNEFFEGMKTEFKMKDANGIDYALGIKVVRQAVNSSRYTRLSQEPFINLILERFDMQASKSQRTPMEPNLKLVSWKCESTSKRLPLDNVFRAKVGSLMYASIATRPDISFALNESSRFLETPTNEHLKAVDRIFKYLNGSKNQCLTYRYTEQDKLNPMKDVILTVYCDASFAGDLETAKSTSGYFFVIAGCAIHWKSKRQSVVAKSSTEAEYVSLSACVTEVMWLREMLAFLGFPQTSPTMIHEDNQSCIALANTPKKQTTAKHIATRFHHIREHIGSGSVALSFLATDEMAADTLTKSLSVRKFESFRTDLGLEAADLIENKMKTEM